MFSILFPHSASPNYEYHWQVYQNGVIIDRPVTNSDRLHFDKYNKEGSYQVAVTVRNVTIGFSYPNASIQLN